MTPASAGGWLREILAHPGEDFYRLAFADAVEEGGDAARAEFCRVQVALTKDPICPLTYFTLDELRTHRDPSILHVAELGPEPKPPCGWCPVCLLRRSELDLFERHGAAWFGPCGCLTPPNDRERRSGGEFRVVRRGFVESVACTLAAWTGSRCNGCRTLDYMSMEDGGGGRICSICHGKGTLPGVGPALVAAQPVTAVATEKVPYHNEAGDWVWLSDATHPEGLATLPAGILALLDGGSLSPLSTARYYPTRAAADAALSRALLKVAHDEP